MRIGVVRSNDIVLPFWSRLGFVETGEIKPYRYANLESETVVMEKPRIEGSCPCGCCGYCCKQL